MEVEAKEADFHRLNRRQVYLYRLAGDDVLAKKVENQSKAPVMVVFRFLVYAIIATAVIKERSKIESTSEANLGIEQSLENQIIEHTPFVLKFNNISNVQHVQTWLALVMERVRTAGEQTYSNELSLNSYNRVVPRAGVCMDAAAVILTFKRVRMTPEYELTTTDRFRRLYPQAWMKSTIEPGEDGMEAEETEPIDVGDGLKWFHTPACGPECPLGRNSGYRGAGGYVAVVTASPNNVTYVHLADDNGTSEPNETIYHCDDSLKRSGTVLFNEFLLGDPFFDNQLGSLTAEFFFYNANLQSMSHVAVKFHFTAAGNLAQKSIRSDTMLLDVYHPWIRFFEYSYLVFTCGYFCELIYRGMKDFPGYFKDVWTYVNACSIIGSFSCFTLWYDYTPQLSSFLKNDAFLYDREFEAREAKFLMYIFASSFATFTIFLRLLQFLASTESRVVLLMKTIYSTLGNIGLYLAYLMVILLGFQTFAMAYFSQDTNEFADFFHAFVSMSSMFMGKIEVMDGVKSTWKVPFMWLFLFFFFFLGVQTFNAIINYSYNRASEDMKAVFEREEYEKQRKELQKRLHRKKTSLSQMFWRLVHPKSAAAATEDSAETAPEGDATSSLEALETPAVVEVQSPDLGSLDPAVREKVQEYLGRDDFQGTRDGLCTMTMYVVMVFCYIWFVYVNVRVEQKGALRESIRSAVEAVEVPYADQTGVDFGWHDIQSLSDVVSWITQGLPLLIFNSTAAETFSSGVARGFIGEKSICIKTWNCLVSGRSAAGPGNNIVRITQRRSISTTNEGAQTEFTPLDDRFIGGYTGNSSDAVPNARVMTPDAGFHETIPAWSAFSVSEDREQNFSLTYNYTTESGSEMIQFCESLEQGVPGSYQRTGGIVCLLDADSQIFEEQMSTMVENGFFSKSSATFVVELVTHNANRDMLSFTTLELRMTPTGRVVKVIEIQSSALFGLEVAVDRLGEIISRIVPGVIYIFFVVVFTVMLYNELKREHTRRSPFSQGGKKSFLRNVPLLMLKDSFRIADALSFAMSFYSFLLYILWLEQDAEMSSQLNGDFSSFVDFASDLVFQEKLYNRLSSLNMLIIFCRPLRFMRGQAQIKRLFQTIEQARQDIFWFLCALSVFLTSCTLLAHVSFGPNFTQCSTLGGSLLYCFNFMIGSYDGFWTLYEANATMAVIFFFPYLLLTYCVCMNIFFAILDRFYLSADVPPLNFKQKLKPVFSKICRCIEWDDDFVVEEDPSEAKKEGPMSRAARVEVTAQEIKDIKMRGTDADPNTRTGNALTLTSVCDPDERMNAVIRWSREEAKGIVDEFQRLLAKKQEAKNIDMFIKQLVMKRFQAEAERSKKEMEEAFRQMQYHTMVHELMAVRDQQTLSKYILLLEQQIQKKMVEQYGLSLEVQHLRGELDNMRYTKADLKQMSSARSDTVAEENQSSLGASEDEDDEGIEEEDEALVVTEGPARDPNSVAELDDPKENKATANMLEKLGFS